MSGDCAAGSHYEDGLCIANPGGQALTGAHCSAGGNGPSLYGPMVVALFAVRRLAQALARR